MSNHSLTLSTCFSVFAIRPQVLLGRGKPFQNHWGNLQMVKLLEERQEDYLNADRFQKTCLSWEIVQKIQTEMNGRFLEKTDSSDEWYVIYWLCLV